MTGIKRDTPILVMALVLSFLSALLSYQAAGATLGLLIGAICFATLITPPLALAVSQRSSRAMLDIVVTFGAAIVCTFHVRDVRVAIVLLIYVAALAGLAHLLRSSALVILIALMWLSWPIWLAPHLHDTRIVDALVVAHPIFALNSIDPTLGIWTQQPLMYRLTTLGQDVPYRLPQSILPCVITHGITALALLLPEQRRNHPGDDSPSDR